MATIADLRNVWVKHQNVLGIDREAATRSFHEALEESQRVACRNAYTEGVADTISVNSSNFRQTPVEPTNTYQRKAI